MNLQLQSVFITANETYFATLAKLFLIVETEYFKEFHIESRGIFVRHDKRIKLGEVCAMFLEPQLNMTRCVRDGVWQTKLQLSIVRYDAVKNAHANKITIAPVGLTLTKEDFIEGIEPCAEWRKVIEKFLNPEQLQEQTELPL